MNSISLTVEATVRLKSTDVIPLEKYNKAVQKGKLLCAEQVKENIISAIKKDLGADEVEILQYSQAISEVVL